MNIWWITIKYNSDLLGARFSDETPLEATMYWNGAEPRKKPLQRAYTYTEVVSTPHHIIQQGVMGVAGFEMGALSDMRFVQGDLDWDVYCKEQRGS